MLRRLFPTLAEWPPEKWLVVPIVLIFIWIILIEGLLELLVALGWIGTYTAASALGEAWWI